MWLNLLPTPPPPDRDDGGAAQPSGEPDRLRRMGMWLFLASLTTLFAPFLIAHLFMRIDAGQWPPGGLPPWPAALWLSTALIIATSLAMEWAARALRSQGTAALRRALVVATLLAVAFLACQSYCWSRLFDQDYPFTLWRVAGFAWFFMVIHALHVIGGVAALGLVIRNTSLGRYSRTRSAGVRHCASYWHFIDAVWLVMFTVMFLPV